MAKASYNSGKGRLRTYNGPAVAAAVAAANSVPVLRAQVVILVETIEALIKRINELEGRQG